MRTNALIIVAFFGSLGGAAAQSSDTFEIMLAPHGGHSAHSEVIRLEADQLEIVQCCYVTLRQGAEVVAALQSHQVALVVNRSAAGERSYEVFQHGGEALHVCADRMVPEQNGLVLFYTAGRLIGVASQNSAQIVIDAGVRLDRDPPMACRPSRSIR